MRSIDADTLWRKMEGSPWNDNADRDLAQEMVLSMPTLTTPTIGHCKIVITGMKTSQQEEKA